MMYFSVIIVLCHDLKILIIIIKIVFIKILQTKRLSLHGFKECYSLQLFTSTSGSNRIYNLYNLYKIKKTSIYKHVFKPLRFCNR